MQDMYETRTRKIMSVVAIAFQEQREAGFNDMVRSSTP
jgi:hypothetical protein